MKMNTLPTPPQLPNDSNKVATIVHRIATVLLWIAYILALFLSGCTTVFLTGCSTSHSVTQSTVNKATGDSIVIRYEQIGAARRALK